MTRFILSVLLLLVFITVHGPARAADTPQEAAEAAAISAAGEKTEAPAEAKEEPKKDEAASKEEITPEQAEQKKAAEDVYGDTKAIAAKISPEEQKHFFMMYSNYNIIGTVKMVQGDVTKAIESCGAANPEMKDALNSSLKDWNAAVTPVIKEAEVNVNNMVVAQNYAKPDDIKKVFKGLDKTRDLASKQIEKTPVTTKDACEYLQGKMSDTKDNFTRLLKGTLMSVPQAIPSNPDADATKAEEKPAGAAPAPDEKKE